mgnify:CR=1 FL=1
MKFLNCHKMAIQTDSLLFQYSRNYLDSGLTQHPDSSPGNFRKRIETGHDDPRYLLLDNQFAARGCFPIMRTRFERNIDRRFSKQLFILNRTDGIDFGMCFSAPAMIPFSDNLPFMHDHSPHHRVRRYVTAT